jgi:hypothetical protein
VKINGILIPANIVKAYEDYGFAKPLETAVATRSAYDWYAILFKDSGEFYAVDFQTDFEGRWEVSNDYVGPFESVEAFQTERLVSSFI